MTSIESVTLEVPDPAAADAFYTAAFGLGAQLRAARLGRADDRLSRVHAVARGVPAGHGRRADRRRPRRRRHAAEAGQEVFWGYGGVVQAPDGTIWKVATSAKKDTGPATREIDEIVLLLGVADVAASKRFYVDRGLTVAKSFGRKYVEFDTVEPVKLALYGRRALAKDAGVPPDGSGSHRIVIGSDAGSFTDPDGFDWEPPARPQRDGARASAIADHGPNCDGPHRSSRRSPMSPQREATATSKPSDGIHGRGTSRDEGARQGAEGARARPRRQGRRRERRAREDRRDARARSRHGRAAARIVKASAPDLSPRTWYGMPAYAKDARSSASSNPRRSSRRGTRRSASATRRTSTTASCGRPPSR